MRFFGNLPALAVSAFLFGGSAMAQSSHYFVDCSALTNGDGSKASPWNSLASVDGKPFAAGDTLSFRRGTTCSGVFQPKGSGSPGAPIRVNAYGEGPRPKIEPPAGAEFGVRLRDQGGWEIADLDIRGGTKYGVFITADSRLLRHIVLKDLEIHDVNGLPAAKATGAVVIAATQKVAGFEDVSVDGVQAHNVTQWSGIYVSGQRGGGATRGVTVRNSLVHDVAGDGIVLFGLADGLIEHSVAYRTGLALSDKVGTPNAIWTWNCTRCTVQDNEAFLTDSPGIDGGAFDVDWANTQNTVRRNYGHDTQGYCFAVFAAFGDTRDSEVEDNLCIANGLSPRLAMRQGAAFLMTWNKGMATDVRIHNNRIFWNPPCACPPVKTGDAWDASNVSIAGNVIDSTTNAFFSSGLKFQGKNSLDRFVTNPADQDRHLRGSYFDPARKPQQPGRLSLWLPDSESSASRAALLVLITMAAQFHSLGLNAELHIPATTAEFAQLDDDWHLRALGISNGSRAVASQTIRLELEIPGQPTLTWSTPLDFRAVGFALRSNFGTPIFSSLP